MAHYELLIDGRRRWKAATEDDVRRWLIEYRDEHVEDDPDATHVQVKKVSLDAPLTRYLPWAGAKATPIRIRDLLDHRSGLADYTTFPLWLAKADRSASTRPRGVLAFVLAQPLLFRPGHVWRYS